MTYKVGYSQSLITPSLDRPVYLAGFGQDRRAQSIHDDLTVRSLALQDDHTTLVLAALDLIGLFRPYVQQVIAQVHAKQPGVKIILASTHTHHGPDTMGLWGPNDHTSGVDPEYIQWVIKMASSTILVALQNLQPASLKTCALPVPGLAKNARNPEIVDDELTLAQFVHPQTGQPLVSLFNFPCHPEVLWEHNPQVTADYPFYLRQAVEQSTGAPCIFFSGALGGMMTPDVKDHSFAEAEAMGNALAQAGLSALTASPILANLPPLQVHQRGIAVKLTNPLFKLAIRRKLIPEVRNSRGEVITSVSLLKIGALWLAGVPGELLPKLGQALKAELLKSGAGVVGIIGLANDEVGYILPREDFRYPWNPFKPGGHYEETMSLSKQIGPQVLQAVVALSTE
jgi:hypothetical protein